MQHSESISELAAALAKAQGAMRPAAKNQSNPFHNSRYADLAAVVEAGRKPLSDNGLAVLMAIEPAAEGPYHVLTAKLVHASGQWVQSQCPIRPGKSDLQAFGAAVTYAKRYLYAALVGVVVEDEDDDGNAALSAGEQARKQHDKVTPAKTHKLLREISESQSEADLVDRVWPMVGAAMQQTLNQPESDQVCQAWKDRRRVLRGAEPPGSAGNGKELGAKALLRRRGAAPVEEASP